MFDIFILFQWVVIDFIEFKCGWCILLFGFVGICISISVGLFYGFGILVIFFEQVFGWSWGELQVLIIFLFVGVVIFI